MGVVKGKRARAWILAIAGALLLAALVWRVSGDDELAKLASRMQSLGCEVYGEDFYVQGDYPDTTIAALLPDADMQTLVAASKASGFASDVETQGDVVVILARLADGGILTVYALNGEPELCFIQAENSDTVRPVGGNDGT